MSGSRVSRKRAQKRIAVIWFAGFFVLFILVALQVLTKKYGEDVGDAVSWFLPTTMPISALIVGVIVAESRLSRVTQAMVDSFLVRLGMIFSATYLLLVAGTIVAASFSADPVELLKDSNLFLGPFQGLTSGVLGAFYVQPGEEPSDS